MNPTRPVFPAAVVRIPQQDGERRRDPRAGQQFRQALQEREPVLAQADAQPAAEPPDSGSSRGPSGPGGRAASAPTAPGLQPRGRDGRRDQEPPHRHVDVLA